MDYREHLDILLLPCALSTVSPIGFCDSDLEIFRILRNNPKSFAKWVQPMKVIAHKRIKITAKLGHKLPNGNLVSTDAREVALVFFKCGHNSFIAA